MLVIGGAWPSPHGPVPPTLVGWLARPDLVSIAALGGVVEASACALALACDLRVAATGAQLSLTPSSEAVLAPFPALPALAGLVGRSRALEIAVTGRRLDAGQARDLGLVSLVVPTADLAGAARDLAGAVLAAGRDLVTETKALLAGAGVQSLDEQCEADAEARARLSRGAD